MKREKLVNFRLPFALALSLACGIAFSFLVSYFNAPVYVYFTAVPVTAVIFITTAFVTVKKSSLVCCAAVLIFFLCGAAYTAVKTGLYDQSEITEGEIYTITGRVEDVVTSQSGADYLVLNGAVAGGKKLGGKVIVYLGESAGDYCAAGYSVSFSSALYKYDLFAYGELNYRAADGIKYYCTVNSGLEASYAFSLFGSVRSGIYGALMQNVGGETASVAYAMLTGDTSSVSDQTLSSFRYGGIAHVFAVSGLHIGVLYSALSLLFKKFKTNKYADAAIKIIFLILYSGVCGFSPSSVRAAVMCAVLAVSKLIHKKYDSLNALSAAVIILLLVNPLYLFDVGFILSVSAVLGIIILSRNVGRLFGKLPKKLSGGLSVGLSAQAATFPALMLSFGYISAAGLLLNLLVLPIMSVIYVIIFAGTVISAVIPPAAAFILPSACLPLELLVNAAVAIGFENAIVAGFGGGWVAVVTVILILALSDKINLKRVARLCAVAVTACAIILLSVAQYVIPSGVLRITASAYYGGGMVIIRSSEGTVLVVTEDLYAGRLPSTLARNGAAKPDALIILGGENCLQSYYGLGLSVPFVYLSQDHIAVGLTGDAAAVYSDCFTLCGVDYAFCDSYSLKAVFNGVSFGICAGESVNIDSANVLFSLYENASCAASETYYFNRVEGLYGESNIYDGGDLHIAVKYGKIYSTGIYPSPRD